MRRDLSSRALAEMVVPTMPRCAVAKAIATHSSEIDSCSASRLRRPITEPELKQHVKLSYAQLPVIVCYFYGRRPMTTSSDEDIGRSGFEKGQTHRKVATQSLRSKEPRLYDSGTAVIQSLHRTVSARVVRVSRQQMAGGQVMRAYDSNAVNPPACGASPGRARNALPSSWTRRIGVSHTGVARALRAW